MNDKVVATVPHRAAQPVSFEQQLQLAKAFAASGLFGVETADQALALMALCEAEGLHPAIAVRDFHIIKGTPSLKADAMLARFQSAGGKVRWIEMSDERVEGEFSHPAGGTITIDWDMERAQRAGLAGRDNWKKFRRAMLRSRVISEGVRSVYPGIVTGVYTPEEVQDFDGPLSPATEAPQIQPPRSKSSGGQQQAQASPPPPPPLEQQAQASPPPPPPPPPANGAKVADNHLRVIRGKAKGASLTDVDICNQFGVKALEELTVDQLNPVLKWISERANG